MVADGGNPMKPVWKGLLLASLGIVSVGTTGCESLQQLLGINIGDARVDSDTSSGERIGAQVLTTENGSNVLVNREAGIELTLPASWTEDMRLHESAELQASAPEQDLYIVVVAEEDESLLRFGLADNAERYRNLLISRLNANGRFTGQAATDTAFVGSNFANQSEIRGEVEDSTPLVYLHTTVVSEQRYYQIVAWTTQAQYNAYRSELQTITETFREIDEG